jgi:ketosteroid isomerase-like protein
MHQFVLSAVLVGGLVSAAAGQSAAASSSSAQSALIKLEDSWATAMVKRDGKTFDRLLSSGFVYTEDAALMSRDDVLHEMTAGADTVSAAHNEGMKVHLFGSTGVVTGWLVVKGRGKSGAFEHRYRFTDTWTEKRGKWQIVAAQDYLVPK